jgi:ATP synthase protein I
MDKTNDHNEFQEQVNKKERQKLKAKHSEKQSIWYGFSTFGLVGWSVVVPTVLFALLGLWLDKHYPGKHSYTLALLIAGLVLGCLNAWYWVNRKMEELQDEQDEPFNDENDE